MNWQRNVNYRPDFVRIRKRFIAMMGLSVVVVIVLPMLLPQSLQAAPAGPGDWSKVRLFGHAYRNDDFTSDQYAFIRDHMYLFTIEKRHAKNIYGGDKTEKAAAETAKKLIKNNPNMRVLLYWSTNTAYGNFYTPIQEVIEKHPDWVEEVRAGTVRWTYPNTAARNWWADTADQIVKNSALTGVFGDGAPGAGSRGHLDNVAKCLERLSSFVIYNGYRVQSANKFTAGASTLAHADGVFCEAFFRSSVETADEGEKLMEELLAIPDDKYILCRGAGDCPFGSSHDFSLACYLIIANDYSFFSWGGRRNSYAADDSLLYWSDDFDKKIGKPLGKASKHGYAYHRDFEHCTVDVDLKEKTSSIVWKPADDWDQSRNFTDTKGRIIKARLIGYDTKTGMVSLKRADGRIGKIPIEQLSAADQERIKSKGDQL